MKKKVYWLIPFLILGLFLTGCSRNKVYGTVVVSSNNYNQIQTNKKYVNQLLKALEKFDSEKPKTAENIYSAVDKLDKEASKNMNSQNKKALRDVLIDNNKSIKNIIKNAYQNHYGFDDDLSGSISTEFYKAIHLTVKPITKQTANRKKIYNEFIKETKAQQKLNNVGNTQ
ncbi:hypothetical protein NVV76_01570 [Pediococcus ethanolidurans]|uniref:hypothetical protein n=1 Tax=Pediococcus ethanolidurans TaxID=319653 RepID=UPI001C1EA313|nr:hypothetical protein [Pediococcus ethanolidurans]MBU7555971.1 hypothetical protein [Pediococcus ethanolidurans]MBU7563894.1 hypothetical protein [Pediococcus ethanolidurans]MCT4399040.1 hypothetical protein [Pediococcus ethanolidurans]MCV3322605.1 hypothetical protein [Pediococcus ethanolidurans]MCV3322817.1 hypothetical protein [Pediococcus ethanolidurans]